MEYRCLGRSGLEVSAVGLGTNNFGARIDYQQTDRVIHQAVDIGVNLIDTANIYGKTLSEEYIGKSTKGIRGQVLLATKVAGPTGEGPNQGGFGRRSAVSTEIGIRPPTDRALAWQEILGASSLDIGGGRFQDPMKH